MPIRKMRIPTDEMEGLGHYLYDLSIPLPERREKRLYFSTGLAAANFLGVPPQRVYNNRRTKHKIWSESLNGWFAVRLAEPGNDLLDLCNKHLNYE